MWFLVVKDSPPLAEATLPFVCVYLVLRMHTVVFKLLSEKKKQDSNWYWNSLNIMTF